MNIFSLTRCIYVITANLFRYTLRVGGKSRGLFSPPMGEIEDMHWHHFPVGNIPSQSDWVAKHLLPHGCRAQNKRVRMFKLKVVGLDSDPYNFLSYFNGNWELMRGEWPSPYLHCISLKYISIQYHLNTYVFIRNAHIIVWWLRVVTVWLNKCVFLFSLHSTTVS